MIKKTTLLITLLISAYSCGKKEENTITPEPKYEYDTNSEQYSGPPSENVTPQYENTVSEQTEPTNIEKYSQLKNNDVTIECETTVEFVDGKSDNITIKMQIPHEEPTTINLRNPVKVKSENSEIISKMYTDNNDEKVIFIWRKDMSKISIMNGDNAVMFLR
ncbi:hypothetical protein DR871_009690 [Flavobacterium petrolei]|uniref:Lipoprotein n=1 Tax=Flavobacterium petrolei TaxID=2259594 RepID=A0A482TJC0_9FLAO|nr:hypothetical protein [Flavobacterium petrolei]RYJ51463.1 hypothetical protein DR871_009690 [Flavobacterium petrolei]